jgi:hypothetical protein
MSFACGACTFLNSRPVSTDAPCEMCLTTGDPQQAVGSPRAARQQLKRARSNEGAAGKAAGVEPASTASRASSGKRRAAKPPAVPPSPAQPVSSLLGMLLSPAEAAGEAARAAGETGPACRALMAAGDAFWCQGALRQAALAFGAVAAQEAVFGQSRAVEVRNARPRSRPPAPSEHCGMPRAGARSVGAR